MQCVWVMHRILLASSLAALSTLGFACSSGSDRPTELTNGAAQALLAPADAPDTKCTIKFEPRAPKDGDRVTIYIPGSDGKPAAADVFKPWPENLVVAVVGCPFPGYESDEQFQGDVTKICKSLSDVVETEVGTKPAREVDIVGASFGGILASCLATHPPAGIKPDDVIEYGGSVPNCAWANPTCRPNACLIVGKDDDIHNAALQKECLGAFGDASTVVVCPGGHAPSAEGLCTFQQLVFDAGAH
jgi:hypothetical protein